jgi:branched-chain amino acid transport system substrate-binding protein
MKNQKTPRRSWLIATVGAALLVSLTLLACDSDDNGNGGNGDDTPAATEASPGPTDDGSDTPAPSGDVITQEQVLAKDPNITKTEELEWGAMFEQTGPLAGFGEPSLDGLRLAVQDINAAGGFQVGDTIYTVKLVERDTKSTQQDALAVATELVRDNNLKIIWGPASVGDPEATTVTQGQQVLHICPCPQRELTALSSQEKADNDNKWAFQTLAAPSKFLPGGAASNRVEHPEYTSFATICVNSQTGHAFCDFFSEAYENVGLEHVGEVFFPDGTTDFNPFITTLRQDNPDIILNFTDAGIDQFALLKSSCQLDVGKFYIAVALEYELFKALVGCEGLASKYVAAGAAPRNNAMYTSEKARVFFDEKYKSYKDPLPFAAFAAMLTYDPAFMLIAAMQQADSVDDTTAIAEALKTIRYSGYGEDEMYFDSRNIIVTGNDACTIYQDQMTCEHIPPPQAE